MYQTNLCKDTCDLKLWMSWWRSWVEALTARQEIPLNKYLDCSKDTVLVHYVLKLTHFHQISDFLFG